MKSEPQNGPSPDSVVAPIISTTNTTVVKEKEASYWAVLRNRNYALLFWGYLISSAGTQMQIVAVAWQVLCWRSLDGDCALSPSV
jgi:hypothetical protein